MTWLCGLTGAIAAVEACRVGRAAEAVLVTNMAALVLLTIATTYIGIPIPLFTEPQG